MNIYWITQIDRNTLHKTSRIELANALRERGHNVKLIIQKNIGEQHTIDENIIYLPTVSYTIISRFLFNLVILLYFPFITFGKKIDIIIIDGGNVYPPFALTLKLLGYPLVMDLRTLPTKYMKSIQSIFFDSSIFLSKIIVKGYTTITPELKNILVKKYKIKNSKIGIWTSGVSFKSFKKPIKTVIETNFFKDPQYFYLMYHGKYSRSRGIEDLIKSIAELEDTLKKNIKLIIIGFDCSKNNDFIRLGNQLNVNKNLEFIPVVEHEKMPSYINMCHVGVIPLPTDDICWRVSAPLKTLEYLAMGKPIIATNIPFHHEIFEKGKCGVLIENSEPASIANAVSYLYKNKEKLDSMGKIGREIAERYYTWEKSAHDLEVFIKRIVS
ncbi:MAG: glycosyltransferase [Candidatus Thermoplasmatota archaeon]|nr:glycosyltransferase [Candidatus Thermoplasmatota archaeon]